VAELESAPYLAGDVLPAAGAASAQTRELLTDLKEGRDVMIHDGWTL
jgi:hypothetical protein